MAPARRTLTGIEAWLGSVSGLLGTHTGYLRRPRRLLPRRSRILRARRSSSPSVVFDCVVVTDSP